MTFMVGLIVFMDDLRQFGFPLLERDAFRQFVFIDCAKSNMGSGNILHSWVINLLFLNVFCRIIFFHFPISFSTAKVYNFLNSSIQFHCKKKSMFLSHRNHPEADQRGGTVVALLAVDADVVTGVEVAAAKRDTPLSNHLRHIAAHVE